MTLEADKIRSEYWICHYLAKWAETIALYSLSLKFFFCKIGQYLTVSTSRFIVKIKWNSVYKDLSVVPGTQVFNIW